MRDNEIVPESAHNIELIGHTDQGGRGDGVQVMVARGHAYVGTRVSRGVMVTEVRDPRHPKSVNFMPIHPNSWCMHLQTAEDLLLCIEELDLKALLSQKDYYSQSNQVDSRRYGVRGTDFSAGSNSTPATLSGNEINAVSLTASPTAFPAGMTGSN